MALVRVEPMGLLTRKNKRASKSPKRKMIMPVGVELTSLSLLRSKSTSESHRRKTKTVEPLRSETEKTEKVHSKMVLGRRSTEILLT